MPDPYEWDEAETRQREDDEQLEYWLQHDEDAPDPDVRA